MRRKKRRRKRRGQRRQREMPSLALLLSTSASYCQTFLAYPMQSLLQSYSSYCGTCKLMAAFPDYKPRGAETYFSPRIRQRNSCYVKHQCNISSASSSASGASSCSLRSLFDDVGTYGRRAFKRHTTIDQWHDDAANFVVAQAALAAIPQ